MWDGERWHAPVVRFQARKVVMPARERRKVGKELLLLTLTLTFRCWLQVQEDMSHKL